MNKRKKRLLIVFVCIVMGAAGVRFYMGSGEGTLGLFAHATEAEPLAAERRVPVVLTAATRREFVERLAVQGNLEAKNFALVNARIPGTIDAIFVNEGDVVVAGETRLFQTDPIKIEKALEVSQLDFAVAQCALREKRAYLERIDADFEKAEIDYRRFQGLREKSAVSADALEQQESRFKQAKAMQKHALSLIDLAVEQERQAQAAVEIAKKTFGDTLVVAPISGNVSRRFMEPGENGDPGKPVIRIDDNSIIEVSAFLPSQYYDRVKVGETPIRIRVYSVNLDEQTVSYKSPTIDPKLRTFEIKCTLAQPPQDVVPGAMAEIEVLLERRTALGIPIKAVQSRGAQRVAFVVENDTARMVAVETGLETDGWVELRGEPFAEGTLVATMGQFLLKDGSPVTVQQRAPEGEAQ